MYIHAFSAAAVSHTNKLLNNVQVFRFRRHTRLATTRDIKLVLFFIRAKAIHHPFRVLRTRHAHTAWFVKHFRGAVIIAQKPKRVELVEFLRGKCIFPPARWSMGGGLVLRIERVQRWGRLVRFGQTKTVETVGG